MGECLGVPWGGGKDQGLTESLFTLEGGAQGTHDTQAEFSVGNIIKVARLSGKKKLFPATQRLAEADKRQRLRIYGGSHGD